MEIEGYGRVLGSVHTSEASSSIEQYFASPCCIRSNSINLFNKCIEFVLQGSSIVGVVCIVCSLN